MACDYELLNIVSPDIFAFCTNIKINVAFVIAWLSKLHLDILSGNIHVYIFSLIIRGVL